MSSAGRDALVAMLSRLKNDLSRTDLKKPEQATRALTGKYPLSGDYLAEVRRLCERGLEDGWLCPPGDGPARTGRVAGTSRWFPYAIEARLISGEAELQVTPKGEVGLCWPVAGKPKFCGEAPGWVVFAPGSEHAHAVKGGSMLLLSFIPDGALRRGVRPRKATSSSVKARSTATRKTGSRKKTASKASAKRKAAPARRAGAR